MKRRTREKKATQRIIAFLMGQILLTGAISGNTGTTARSLDTLVDPKVHASEISTNRTISQHEYDCLKNGCVVEVKEVKKTETPKNEKEQIIAYIHEVFGVHAQDAIAVVGKCENKSWNPKATNHNRNGSIDRGIFQLNSQYWGGEENFNWKTNVDKAYMIFNRAGKTWKPWSCAHVVGQKNYLGK